jgi:hypothetical protein
MGRTNLRFEESTARAPTDGQHYVHINWGVKKVERKKSSEDAVDGGGLEDEKDAENE